MKQFCKEQGLTECSFYAWRKRLQEKEPVRFALAERSARRQERTAEAALELSDTGGKTAAVLRSFIASCKRCGVEPFAWFRDVLSCIPAHSITRLSELLPHNWKSTTSPAQA